jgi:hypothetical protein
MEPGTYQDFVDRVTANLAGSTEGAVTDIYVDANTFHQVMLENKIDPDEVAQPFPPSASRWQRRGPQAATSSSR